MGVYMLDISEHINFHVILFSFSGLSTTYFDLLQEFILTSETVDQELVWDILL